MRTLKFRVRRKSLEKCILHIFASCLDKRLVMGLVFHIIQAAREITGATKLCSIEKRFADLRWESLQNRRNKHKLVIFYKILHDIAPKYVFGILPPLIQDTTTYNLWNAGIFRIIERTLIYSPKFLLPLHNKRL